MTFKVHLLEEKPNGETLSDIIVDAESEEDAVTLTRSSIPFFCPNTPHVEIFTVEPLD